MQKDTTKDNVLQLAQGAIQELAQIEMQKIVQNILDINTHPDKPRELTIKVKFKPNNNRQGIAIEANVTSKLLPNNAVATQMAIGVDTSTGEIRAREMMPQLEGQFDFDGNQQGSPVVLKFKKAENA